MKTIKKPEELVAVATRQGMEMNLTEATVVLGYLEGHDYCLLAADDFTTTLHDLTEGDLSSNDMDYNIRQAVEFCQDMNGDLLLETATKDEPDEEYLLALRKDELILDALMKRAEEGMTEMSHSCLTCIHKDVCLRRWMFLFNNCIVTGQFEEAEDAKENLDIGVGCEDYTQR